MFAEVWPLAESVIEMGLLKNPPPEESCSPETEKALPDAVIVPKVGAGGKNCTV